MNITDVRIRLKEAGQLKGIATITIDDVFVVHDIRISKGEKGLFIAMPNRQYSDGEYRDIAHPINRETRDMLQDVILAKYCEVSAK